MITLFETIASLRPEAMFLVRNGKLEWNDKDQTPPTQEEIASEMKRMEWERLKAKAREQVHQFATDTQARLTNHASRYRLAGWNDKIQRAQRVIAKTFTKADTAILETECDKRGKGEKPKDLAKKQIAKGEALAMAVAVIDGLESSALNAIKSVKSEKGLASLMDGLKEKADKELSKLLEKS